MQGEIASIGRQHPAKLASAIAHHCLGSLAPEQLQAFKNLEAWIKTTEGCRNIYDDLEYNDGDLRDLFELLDHAFFRGLLSRSTVSFHAYFTSALPANTLGRCSAPVQNTKYLRIKELQAEEKRRISPSAQLHRHICTLLHEMLHAVFHALACVCAVCSCRENIRLTSGLSGHGPLWRVLLDKTERVADQRLMRVLQEECGPWVLSCVALDGGRFDVVVEEKQSVKVREDEVEMFRARRRPRKGGMRRLWKNPRVRVSRRKKL